MTEREGTINIMPARRCPNAPLSNWRLSVSRGLAAPAGSICHNYPLVFASIDCYPRRVSDLRQQKPSNANRPLQQEQEAGSAFPPGTPRKERSYMKPHEVESAAQKAKAIAQALGRELRAKTLRAKVAEEKSRQTRMKFKQAKKESRQARKAARRARGEADDAQKAFAAATALAAKAEAKAAKARKKVKSKKTQAKAKSVVRAANKGHRGFRKKRQAQLKASSPGGKKPVALALKPARLRRAPSRNARLTSVSTDITVAAPHAPEPASSIASEMPIATESSHNSQPGEQSHES